MKYLICLGLLFGLGSCMATSSSRTLSPDREPAEPRHHAEVPDSVAAPQ